MNFAPLQNVRGAQGGDEHHNRGLARFDPVVVAGGLPSLTEQVAERLTRSPRARLLEIGCGEGRLLLDLHARFGDAIELQGVNAMDWPVIGQDHELLETNARYQVMPEEALRRARFPPRIRLADAQDLKGFRARQFDFVVSQVTLPHIARKDRVLEESARLLVAGGVFIHELDQLDGAAVELSGRDLPRLMLLRGSAPISTTAYLKKQGLRLHLAKRRDKPDCVFVFYRRASKPLRLRLRFDAALTVVLKRPGRSIAGASLWGVRSAYRPR